MQDLAMQYLMQLLQGRGMQMGGRVLPTMAQRPMLPPQVQPMQRPMMPPQGSSAQAMLPGAAMGQGLPQQAYRNPFFNMAQGGSTASPVDPAQAMARPQVPQQAYDRISARPQHPLAGLLQLRPPRA